MTTATEISGIDDFRVQHLEVDEAKVESDENKNAHSESYEKLAFDLLNICYRNSSISDGNLYSGRLACRSYLIMKYSQFLLSCHAKGAVQAATNNKETGIIVKSRYMNNNNKFRASSTPRPSSHYFLARSKKYLLQSRDAALEALQRAGRKRSRDAAYEAMKMAQRKRHDSNEMTNNEKETDKCKQKNSTSNHLLQNDWIGANCLVAVILAQIEKMALKAGKHRGFDRLLNNHNNQLSHASINQKDDSTESNSRFHIRQVLQQLNEDCRAAVTAMKNQEGKVQEQDMSSLVVANAMQTFVSTLQVIFFLRSEIGDGSLAKRLALAASRRILLEGIIDNYGGEGTSESQCYKWPVQVTCIVPSFTMGSCRGVIAILYTLIGHSKEEWVELEERVPNAMEKLRQTIDNGMEEHHQSLVGCDQDHTSPKSPSAPATMTASCLLLIRAAKLFSQPKYCLKANEWADQWLWKPFLRERESQMRQLEAATLLFRQDPDPSGTFWSQILAVATPPVIQPELQASAYSNLDISLARGGCPAIVCVFLRLSASAISPSTAKSWKTRAGFVIRVTRDYIEQLSAKSSHGTSSSARLDLSKTKDQDLYDALGSKPYSLYEGIGGLVPVLLDFDGAEKSQFPLYLNDTQSAADSVTSEIKFDYVIRQECQPTEPIKIDSSSANSFVGTQTTATSTKLSSSTSDDASDKAGSQHDGHSEGDGLSKPSSPSPPPVIVAPPTDKHPVSWDSQIATIATPKRPSEFSVPTKDPKNLFWALQTDSTIGSASEYRPNLVENTGADSPLTDPNVTPPPSNISNARTQLSCDEERATETEIGASTTSPVSDGQAIETSFEVDKNLCEVGAEVGSTQSTGTPIADTPERTQRKSKATPNTPSSLSGETPTDVHQGRLKKGNRVDSRSVTPAITDGLNSVKRQLNYGTPEKRPDNGVASEVVRHERRPLRRSPSWSSISSYGSQSSCRTFATTATDLSGKVRLNRAAQLRLSKMAKKMLDEEDDIDSIGDGPPTRVIQFSNPMRSTSRSFGRFGRTLTSSKAGLAPLHEKRQGEHTQFTSKSHSRPSAFLVGKSGLRVPVSKAR